MQAIFDERLAGIVTVDTEVEVLSHVKYLVDDEVMVLTVNELPERPTMKLLEASLIFAFTKFVSITVLCGLA